MKALLFIASVLFIVVHCAPSPTTPSPKKHLLGQKECTWGPSYWCKNITSSARCHATKHCIQTVWMHKQLPEDNNPVCQTCLDMVKQARDQLESNETQEEIKEVFEGSCKLIPLKLISSECCKLADEFIPELVETLASEMNPQVVCSVAGLCNNEHVHKLLAEQQNTNITMKPKSKPKLDSCEGCYTVVGIVENKFHKMNRDQVLQGIMEICGRMGSLSDACSNIVITYFNEIYEHLQLNLNPDEVCLMAGECSAKFHTHATNVEITPMSNVGFVAVGEKDDLTCDLCKQLVSHLRDILVTNTTENEFQQVLLGICKQTKSFAKECANIVNEYYPVIYKFLTDELNGEEVCKMAGICQSALTGSIDNAPFSPLVPITTIQNHKLGQQPSDLNRVGLIKGASSVQILLPSPEEAQLPIERIIPQTLTMMGNTRWCTFCEYFLHYVQQAITDPKTETEMKKVVEEACYKLPRTINETCQEFVDTYGDAFVALLAQEIDPSVVCPLLSLCPAEGPRNVEVFMNKGSGNKTECPLCLFAITELEDYLKDKKTEAEIKEALNKLCSHLSNNLAEECADFVSTYTAEIIEGVEAQLNPQELCVFLKCCTDKVPAPSLTSSIVPEITYGGEILTNEIPDNTANGQTLISAELRKAVGKTPQCVICEFVMTELEKEISDKDVDDDIKKIVHGICNHLPKTVKSECNDFVNKYADMVIALLEQSLVPSEICSMINLCTSMEDVLRVELRECAVCEATVMVVVQILENPDVDHDIEHVLEKSCRALPTKHQKNCKALIEEYGDDMFSLISKLSDTSSVCHELGMCGYRTERVSRSNNDRLVGDNKCSWGPGYWCVSEDNARNCGSGATQHCQQKVWLGSAPKTKRSNHEQPLLGKKKCSWGPGYWCKNEDNARECRATKHCQEKVWLGSAPSS